MIVRFNNDFFYREHIVQSGSNYKQITKYPLLSPETTNTRRSYFESVLETSINTGICSKLNMTIEDLLNLPPWQYDMYKAAIQKDNSITDKELKNITG